MDLKLLTKIALLSSYNYQRDGDDVQSNLEKINELVLKELDIKENDGFRAFNQKTGATKKFRWAEDDKLIVLLGENEDIELEVNKKDWEIINLSGW